MYEMLADFKPVYVIELPNRQSEEGIAMYRREIIRFKEELERRFETTITEEAIRAIKETVEIPLVYTVVSEQADVAGKLAAGVDFLNVSGAARTPEIVAHIREQFPEVPIIATGGPTDDTIRATIEAGANAITYTPPTSAELFSESMRKYRGRFA